MTGVIEGPQYEETRKALRSNPHIQGMGDELVHALRTGALDPSTLLNKDDKPNWEFMLLANRRFADLDNGSHGGPLHIGAVAEVLAERLIRARDDAPE